MYLLTHNDYISRIFIIGCMSGNVCNFLHMENIDILELLQLYSKMSTYPTESE